MAEDVSEDAPISPIPNLASIPYVFSFQKEIDLQQVLDYYIALDQSLPQYNSWLFVKDNLLLQINRSVPEDVAKRYAEALDLLEE